MKVKFDEYFQGHPTLLIIPDSDTFESFGGRLEVCFFTTDIDTGKRQYSPWVNVNVSFGGRTEPDRAAEWGECFTAAYQIAVRAMPPQADNKDEIVSAWKRCDELKAQQATA